MKVLQQRVPNDSKHNEIHPKEWDFNIAAYTGTHDSPTIKQWLNEVDDIQVEFFNNYIFSILFSQYLVCISNSIYQT